jgi:hypothetical protein
MFISILHAIIHHHIQINYKLCIIFISIYCMYYLLATLLVYNICKNIYVCMTTFTHTEYT